MTRLGFHNQGAEFYIPQDHPHAHVRVDNAARIVNNVAAIRQYIDFISLSFGNGVNTVNAYRRNPPTEQLEVGSFDPYKKGRLERALASLVQKDTARTIQRALNLLTGMGIDYG